MKRLILFSLIGVFFMTSTSLYAVEKAPLGNSSKTPYIFPHIVVVKAPLGNSNIAVKLNHINFTDDVVENSDVGSGLYFGIEEFSEITPNLYFGIEVGYANPMGIDFELTFVPVEVNVKYAVKKTPNFCIDFGGGLSYNHVEEKLSALSISATFDDWLLGGQFFVDLNYISDTFFGGVNGKYQITQDFQGWDYNYNNWRIGGQVGFMF